VCRLRTHEEPAGGIYQMAPPERGSTHPITAYYSFIDLEKMKGRVGLVG